MNKIIFRGVATAMYTPIKNSRVDYSILSKNIKRQITGGADAIVILGTTGEPYTLSAYEKDKILSCALQTAENSIPVIVGVGNNCTAQTVKNLKRAKSLGARNFLVITPYVNKCTQRGLIYHFEKICDIADCPVIIYDVFKRTGVTVSFDALEKLSNLPNLSGIKLSCGDLQKFKQTIDILRGKIAVYSGDDSLNAKAYMAGASGCISVTSNLIPQIVKRIYTLYTEGEWEKCLALSEEISDIDEVLFENVNPIPLKYAVNLMGLGGGNCRLPLCAPDENVKENIKKVLQKHRLIKEEKL